MVPARLGAAFSLRPVFPYPAQAGMPGGTIYGWTTSQAGLPSGPVVQAAPRKNDLIQKLCLTCGLCCNGVLFRDVELQPGDCPERLLHLGVPLEASKQPRHPRKLRQPCPALGAGNRCQVYADRPARCRDFECALLKAAMAGEAELPVALRAIRETLELAARVRQLLRQLGDEEEALALSRRFQRMQKQICRQDWSEETAALYGQLTLGVHELNLRLGREFYP
jgi:uncharacterized protein